MADVLATPPRAVAVAAALALALALAACGDDGGAGSDADADAAGDTLAAEDTGAPDAHDTLTPDDAGADGVSDTGGSGDTGPGDTAAPDPVACGEGEACNTELLADGRCPGACFEVELPLTCRGTVALGACHPLGWAPRPAETEVDFGDYTVTATDVPAQMTVGESAPLVVTVHNDTAAALTIPLSVRSPGSWDFADASWEGVDELTIPASGDVTLTATLTARAPTTLFEGIAPIVTFTFVERDVFEPRGVIDFAPGDDTVACGGHTYPTSYCDGDDCYETRAYYAQSRCCGDVFFPGAACCARTDCLDGAACVDGVCVGAVPAFGGAVGPPVGRHRVLLVLIDTHAELTAGGACADHVDDVAEELRLADVEGLYDAWAEARFGGSAMDLRWTVRAGVTAGDFLRGDGPYAWGDVKDAVAAYYDGAGCDGFDAYDEVIVSLPSLDLGQFGGRYFGDGFIGVKSPNNAYLLAHELGHGFGGDDLYLTLGGLFEWHDDLMGNDLAAPPLPGDGVLWGQSGFADVDQDGVIDAARFATAPDALRLVAPTAVVTAKGTLELDFGVAAVEGGVDKAVVLRRVRVRVPAASFDADVVDQRPTKVLVFDGTQLDLDAVRAAGELEVGFEARHRFTGADWERHEVVLDETLTLPVAVEE
ncbi:MAG: hypothetical protein KC635_29415 [Myxococcales bacterium]|nr:hypothetical protein [Myxococcales bacterium]